LTAASLPSGVGPVRGRPRLFWAGPVQPDWLRRRPARPRGLRRGHAGARADLRPGPGPAGPGL